MTTFSLPRARLNWPRGLVVALTAGLHFGSFALMADHPRFREAKLGIIVSSVRALQIFLRKNAKLDRLPDFIIVEGPLAGGSIWRSCAGRSAARAPTTR